MQRVGVEIVGWWTNGVGGVSHLGGWVAQVASASVCIQLLIVGSPCFSIC